MPPPPPHQQPARRARPLRSVASLGTLALVLSATAAGCGSDGEESIVEALGSQTVTVQVPPSAQSTAPAAPQELPAVPDGGEPATVPDVSADGGAADSGAADDDSADGVADDASENGMPATGGDTGDAASAPAATARPQPRPTVHVTRSTALRSGPGGRVIGRISPRTEFGSPTVLAVVRQSGSWLGVLTAELPNGRVGWISARARLEVHRNAWSVSASLRRREVVIRRAGRVVDRFPVAIGSPSSPTPTGRFAVTDKLTTGTDASVYGCCILALSAHQANTPQGWGGGDRVAIHGTNLPQSIGTEASLGCLRAPTPSIRRAIDTVPLGTIVTISP